MPRAGLPNPLAFAIFFHLLLDPLKERLAYNLRHANGNLFSKARRDGHLGSPWEDRIASSTECGVWYLFQQILMTAFLLSVALS